jgi:hypothetical protein
MTMLLIFCKTVSYMLDGYLTLNPYDNDLFVMPKNQTRPPVINRSGESASMMTTPLIDRKVWTVQREGTVTTFNYSTLQTTSCGCQHPASQRQYSLLHWVLIRRPVAECNQRGQ